MAEDPQAKTTQEVMEAVTALREEIKKVGKDSPEFKALQERVEAALKDHDEKNQEFVLANQEKEKKAEELAERIQVMELELVKGSAGGKKDYKETVEYKALNMFFKTGLLTMPEEERKTLRTDIDTSGGYLVTPEVDNVITKKVTEISAVRRVARVRTVGKKTLNMPIRTGIPSATYEGEAQAAGESQSAYGSESVNAWRLTTIVPVTQDQLMDADFDMESEIAQDVAESFAQKEGNKYCLGTGVKEPEGFMGIAALQTAARETSTSGTIDPEDMILLTGDLKVGYNPMYGFNRQTLALLRSLQSTNGMFIWHIGSMDQGMGGARPNTIAGEDYIILQDLATISAGNYSVVYADFRRGYVIVDRTGLSVIRDNITEAAKAIIKFTFHRYNTGQVVLQEAFKLLKIKA